MWDAYVKKRGTLNTGLHVEASIARLCALVAQVVGNKDAMPADFSPHFDKPELSLEEAMRLWT